MEVITAHTNTDLDALASMVAAQKLYPEAVLVFPGKLSRNVEEFMSLHKDIFDIKDIKSISLDKVKRIILVDTKNPRRIGKLAELLQNKNIDVHIYDHHHWAEGDARGSVEVVESVGATVTLLVEIIRRRSIAISPLEATIFALGIYGDTGSLLFTSTTPRDVQAVAYLLENGANLSVVAEFLGRPMTDEQKALLRQLLMSAERHVINGCKVLIARATCPEFVVGLAMLTHTISEIERLDVIFTIVHMEDRVHIVARSNVNEVNVAEILAPFMGGGHPGAASATVKKGDINEIAEKIVRIMQDKVRPPLAAADIMSAPVKTVFPETTIAEASQVMMRYGHTGLPVVQGLEVVGVISRRDVEKATRHGLGHAPVKGFMTTNVITVGPNMPVSELRELMIENDIGRVPVVQDGRLLGIVSRTDVLKTLHHAEVKKPVKTVYVSHIRPQLNISEYLRKGLAPETWDLLQTAGEMAEDMGYQLYAAGGVVRDLLIGYGNLDIDLVVEGDGITFARTLGQKIGVKVRAHEKFGTAELVFKDGFKIDVATARVEYYEYPAALPKVETSSIKQDLYRRDFTINAMAVALNTERFGELIDFFGGREDLQFGQIRVLYNLSFIEDPTRILRAVRFEQRYGMNIEPQTLNLLKEAVRQNMLERVSNERIWDELFHIMLEPAAGKMLARLNSLQIWPQVFPGVTYWEVQPVLNNLHQAIKMLEEWDCPLPAEQWLPYMIAILHWSDEETALKICRRYNLNKRQTEKILVTLDKWGDVLSEVWRTPEEGRLGQLAQSVMALPRESYPLLLAVLDEDWMHQRLRRILTAIEYNKPQLDGKYIRQLGIKPGPIYRQALQALWQARLDNRVTNEEEEKQFLHQFFGLARTD
ncbi:CBS domain-containing protein [Desulfurispora thermophila]|uniref:CBS domain-containing protein n=1 Tax=Desulfurispora thermophila TaxID=265470 RepID=UPI0003624B0B|nr:CBS domain-containing protein [Desulfurispora thermophila]